MKPIIFLSLFLVFASAACDSKVNPEDTKTSKAKLVNALPVDGCGWHFSIESDKETIQLLPNNASKEKVNTFIQTAEATHGVYIVDVEITYRLTGQKQSVQCGWGKTGEFDEIDVLQIKSLK